MTDSDRQTGTASAAPRLMIKTMVLENFKSYAGVQEIGPFHKSFSSIVGPNGSGKSNVIDAMMFVFGKRAKKMRLNKISELIHNSDDHKNLDFARVTVHFHEIIDNDGAPNGYDVVPDSDFSVSRVAYRNNTSKYFLNDRNSSFTQVTEKLKDKGIDLEHNRFLILQGEVEQISLMKPKADGPHDEGLLEYLEDIIGSNKYIERIGELDKQVEEVTEERTEKLNRVKTAEKEKDALHGTMTEAVEYVSKECELLKARSVQYQMKRASCLESLAQHHEKIQQLERKLEDERERFGDTTEKLAETETELAAAKSDYAALEKSLHEAKTEFAKFERKDVKLREELKHAKAKQKKLSAKVKKETAEAENHESAAKDAEGSLPKLEAQSADYAKKHEEAEAKLDAMLEELKEETAPLRVQKSKLDNELAQLSKAETEAKAVLDKAVKERDSLQKKAQSTVDKIAEMEGQVSTCEATMKERTADAKRITKELQTKRNALESAGAEQSKLRKDEGKLASKAREARGTAEEARAALASASSQNSVAAALNKLRDSGRMPGLYGRLGDLGSIDATYDVAASTACGALNYIVVDTAETGQKAIRHLREKKLGVATFIILEKQEHLRKAIEAPFEAPEGVPRLFDLVRPDDDKFATAFYFGLRDTIVANDLEQATRLAFHNKKRLRVVTLEGQLIDTSGTMSGGGKRVLRGLLRCGGRGGTSANAGAMTPAAVEAEEKRAHDAAAALERLRARLEELEAEMEQLRNDVSALEVELRKAEMDAETAKTQRADAVEALEELRGASALTPAEEKCLKALASEIDAADNVYSEHSARVAKAREAVLDAEREIAAVGGARVKAARERVAELETRASEAREALGAARAALKEANRKRDRAVAARDKAASEVGEAEKAVETAKEQLRAMEGDAAEVLEAFQRAKELVQEKNSRIEELTDEQQRLRRAASKLRALEDEVKAETDELKAAVRDAEHKAEHWTSMTEQVRAKAEQYAADIAEIRGAAGDEARDDQLPAADAFTVPELSKEELASTNRENVQYQIQMLEEALASMKPNMSAIAEYRRKDGDYVARVRELDQVSARRDTMRRELDSLRKRRLEEFMAGFSVITMKLKEMYQMITLGGDAELELVDTLDPFSEGIVFSVRPPNKSWKNIANLSGGEKTLSSLALVFALHHYKPTPLYVMDEIDAALDFRNVSIVANYIKERTKDAQFVIISLRNNMFEIADRLVGVYKTNNATKTVTINPSAFAIPVA